MYVYTSHQPAKPDETTAQNAQDTTADLLDVAVAVHLVLVREEEVAVDLVDEHLADKAYHTRVSDWIIDGSGSTGDCSVL